MVQVREPAPPPSSFKHQQQHILFRHPGYEDGNNVLFKLQAPDTDDDGQLGLFARFAIDACAVITEDCEDRGWLSLLRDGSNPIDPSSTLRERSYYFHLGAADDPYAIVPNFRQWRYPHKLPRHWQQLAPDSNIASSSIALAPSNPTTALLIRDGSCRLSGCCEQLQVAHVVPQSEVDWWRANDMSRYNTGSAATIDDTANALLLRADLHIAFDKPYVALVPKPATDGSMRLVAHVLGYSPELEQLYHNRELHRTTVGADMLYARFAWTVFTLLDAFLQCGTDRRLALYASDASLADARGFVTGINCDLFSTAAIRKRSQSPKKRKPDRDTVIEYEELAETPVGTSRKHRPTSQARPTLLAAASPAKRICWNPSRSVSTSEYSSLPSPLTPTQPSMDISLSPLDVRSSPPLPAPQLAQVWLETERLRSDPDGEWDRECNWAQQVWGGQTLESDEVSRWLESCGVDLRDSLS